MLQIIGYELAALMIFISAATYFVTLALDSEKRQKAQNCAAVLLMVSLLVSAFFFIWFVKQGGMFPNPFTKP